MNSPMKYKEYSALIEYDDECELFRGEILDINDTVIFYGDSISSLKQAMTDAVEDYLEHCQEIGRTPEKPYSGKISLRMSPELHKRVARKAAMEGKSTNSMLVELIEGGTSTTGTKPTEKAISAKGIKLAETFFSFPKTKPKEKSLPTSEHIYFAVPKKSIHSAWTGGEEVVQ